MKSYRICPISKQPLPDHLHGNAKYHPLHKNTAKQQANSKRYDKIRDLSNTALCLDKILATHYPHSNGSQAISKLILDKERFRWDFNSRITMLEACPVFWILEYGYRFINDKKQVVIYYEHQPV